MCMRNIDKHQLKQLTPCETEPFYQSSILDTTFCRCYVEKFGGHESYKNSLSADKSINQKKRKKKLSTEKQWIDHCKTLQRLSTPKQIGSICFPSRGKKVPLHKLRLRINYLSQPRKPIKKRQYVKNPDDFKLPGAIKDWNAHSKWLLKIAQPRVRDNDPKPRKQERKLRRLRRTLWLAQPKYKVSGEKLYAESFTKPITPVSERALNYYPTERILELSEPKPFIMGRVYMEKVPSACLMIVSPFAKKYKASRRIESLSVPKGCCHCYSTPHLYDLGGKNICPFDCIAYPHELSIPKICQPIRPKDYRHVKYLDVYRMGKQFPVNDAARHKSQQPYRHANTC